VLRNFALRISAIKSSLLPIATAPILLLAFAVGCTSAHQRALDDARMRVGGDPERGAFLIQRDGCGGCHRIPGVAGAGGKAAPSLQHLAAEAYISGNLPNTPENVMRWIESPHSILPNTRMPELGIGHAEARDITTYLWSLR
jgi:cytochrome c2